MLNWDSEKIYLDSLYLNKLYIEILPESFGSLEIKGELNLY